MLHFYRSAMSRVVSLLCEKSCVLLAQIGKAEMEKAREQSPAAAPVA